MLNVKTIEYLDVVNDQDKVIGKASYGDIYKKLLPHRIVHILVFNKKGEMLLQLRAQNRSFCPLHWSTSAGGHIRSGESPKQAAKRELAEELGVKLPLKFSYKDFYVNQQPYEIGLKEFLTTFTVKSNGRFKIGLEVDRINFFTLNEIQQMIIRKEKFHPELLFLLQKHFGIK